MSEDDKPHAEKFRHPAREVDADEDERRFEDQVRRIPKAKDGAERD